MEPAISGSFHPLPKSRVESAAGIGQHLGIVGMSHADQRGIVADNGDTRDRSRADNRGDDVFGHGRRERVVPHPPVRRGDS